nr:ribonuclease H-like domain-containing protein [Tanacetum cinerariifolium]
MVRNHYLEEAKKRTQKRSRNSEPSLMHSARSQSTANGSKLMPRINTQTSRNWPATKNSFVMKKTVPIAEHPRNSRNDSCVIKFLKEVNSRAKVPSNKTTNRNKPVEQISVPKNKKDRSKQDIGSNPEAKLPSTTIPSTSAPSTHTNVHAEENTDNQAEEGEHLQADEFTNPFCAPPQEEAKSSSHNIVQKRRQLATDPEMCMYALTVSTAKPKNIKEAMADSAWIELIQEELYQFDILQ